MCRPWTTTRFDVEGAQLESAPSRYTAGIERVTVGVCAGADTATPALAAIQEVANSRVPTLGYGVSYAIVMCCWCSGARSS